MNETSLDRLVELVNRDLCSEARIESVRPYDPVEVRAIPSPWRLIGTGNYAAVFVHPDYPDRVVKIYAAGRPGFEAEVEVYRRIGSHPAFSECFYARDNFLVLKRLEGITLFDCLHKGLRVPKQVILDIDDALDYARDKGLRPHDVHGKNVMMRDGRGLVVDISDFLEEGEGSVWDDFKRFYFWIYNPLLSPFKIPIPFAVLDSSRGVYRWFRTLQKREA